MKLSNNSGQEYATELDYLLLSNSSTSRKEDLSGNIKRGLSGGLLCNHSVDSMDSLCYYVGGGHQEDMTAG